MQELDKNKDYTIITDPLLINEGEWESFVMNHPFGSIFHTPAFFNAFDGLEKNHSAVFALKDNISGLIVALLVSVIYKEGNGLKGFFSKRSIIMGAPIVKDNDPQLLEILLSVYNQSIKSKAIYSQFRNMYDMTVLSKAFSNCGYYFEEHLNYIIDLTKSEDELWKNLHSKRRNEIRKAGKKDISVREVFGVESLKETYLILRDVYANVNLPLPEYETFLNAYNALVIKNNIRIFAAIYDEKIVGVMLQLCYKGRIYDWYAGSYREHYDKCPNDALPWYLFLITKQEGYKIFDFGGAGKPGVPYGVRDYKKKFGGEEVNYGRFEIVHNKILMFCGKTLFRIWRGLKKIGL